MILAATGHRPPKLGGYSPDVLARLVSLAEASIRRLSPTLCISGMALGWDTAFALAARNLSIPFDAYVPCTSQARMWPPSSQRTHAGLLMQARSVITISPTYTPSCMQDRNIAMVDACTDLLALWDGSPGGTGNCIHYARSRPVTIHNVWDEYSRSMSL